jgi:hypothetical protein
MAPDQATAKDEAQATVSALYEQARQHKRLSERHRHKAQRTMQELHAFAQRCHELGIEVEITFNNR